MPFSSISILRWIETDNTTHCWPRLAIARLGLGRPTCGQHMQRLIREAKAILNLSSTATAGKNEI